ncbi:MAG: Coenzyme F420 hydrogenase/dehydrogenase, beta subunit C-terminal domain [Nitrososphaerota archaeon]
MIQAILESDLCIGCGACYAVCPFEAIDWSVENLPKIILGRCKSCDMCLKVCPSYKLCEDLKRADVYGSSWLGPYLNIYLGHSTNDEIRYAASSGGIATQLLIYALRKGLIDGAALTYFAEKDPFRLVAKLAFSEEEIIKAMGSKYSISPVCTTIRDMLNHEGRFVFVGLPCHLLALNKIMRGNEIIAEKIKFCIGLFCGHTMYPLGTEFILRKEGIFKEHVKALKYRGDGWPGGITVELRDGTKKFLPYDYWVQRYFSTYFFTPLRCLVCNDATSELSDISLGDAWLPQVKRTEKLGVSIVISRTERGERLLLSAHRDGYINLKKLHPKYAVQSQMSALTFKKKHLISRMKLTSVLVIKNANLLGFNINQSQSISGYVGALLLFSNYFLCKRAPSLIFGIPRSLLRVYSEVLNFLHR